MTRDEKKQLRDALHAAYGLLVARGELTNSTVMIRLDGALNLLSRLEAQQPTGEPFTRKLDLTAGPFRGPKLGFPVARRCQRCGFPESRHRPEAEAHHSECTLEQFMPTGEQPTPPECPARNFRGLWSQVLQCFQDTRPSVGDAYRLKMLLVEHEKEQG